MFTMDKGLSGNAIMTETAGALGNIFSDNHQLARDRYNLLEALLRDILLLAETFALTRGGSYISVRDLVDAYKVVRRPFFPRRSPPLHSRCILNVDRPKLHKCA